MIMIVFIEFHMIDCEISEHGVRGGWVAFLLGLLDKYCNI